MSCEAAPPDAITLRLDGHTIPVDRAVFSALFDSSVVHSRRGYVRALETSTVTFSEFVDLARLADIPYSLFFAPPEVVQAQLKDKAHKLLAGVSKASFSLNSRSKVQLRDIELIVKDVLRKQGVLKDLDRSLVPNTIIDTLRGSRSTVVEAAAGLRARLDLPLPELRAKRTKELALEYLIERLEAKQLLVSRSVRGYMPQNIPQGVKFSGLCVKDKKVPFIFLTGGDVGDNAEPAGRKIFTLALLTVFVAAGKFAPVSYDDQTGDLIGSREYEIAEELLMPAAERRSFDTASLEGAKATADRLRVTPSAFVMRARRLGLITADQAHDYLDELAAEFAARPKSRMQPPRPENAVRRYAGTEFTRRMLRQLDRRAITAGEFCRVVCLNRLSPGQIPLLQATL